MKRLTPALLATRPARATTVEPLFDDVDERYYWLVEMPPAVVYDDAAHTSFGYISTDVPCCSNTRKVQSMSKLKVTLAGLLVLATLALGAASVSAGNLYETGHCTRTSATTITCAVP